MMTKFSTEIYPEDSASQEHSSQEHRVYPSLRYTQTSLPRPSAPPFEEIISMPSNLIIGDEKMGEEMWQAETECKSCVELDNDASLPSLQTVQSSQSTMYLFDNADGHPRLKLHFKLMWKLSNAAWKAADTPGCCCLQMVLVLTVGCASMHTRRGLPSNMLSIHCFRLHSNLKVKFRPDMAEMNGNLHFEVEKKKDEWKLRAHLAYKKQQHQLTKQQKNIDAKLSKRRRDLQKQRAHEQLLKDRYSQMHKHNELMKIQKRIEQQQLEKNKELDVQIDILDTKMAALRDQVQKQIALEDVAKSSKVLLNNYIRSDGTVLAVDSENVYHISQIEQVIPNTAGNDADGSFISSLDGQNFWNKMEKFDKDMSEIQKRISVLKGM